MEQQGEVRRIPIHRSLIRPQIFLGGESDLVKGALLVAGLIYISGMSLVSLVAGLGTWLLAMGILVPLVKEDPQMSKVYLRSIRYRSYYPARSGLFSPIKKINAWRR